MSTPIVPEVVEQHAEEASFLWTQRNRALDEPHYTLSSLGRLDERVEAHLDGLRIAGDSGWETSKAGMEAGEPGGVFAAASVAFEGGREERIQAVLAAPPEAHRGVVSALGWLPFDRARGAIEKLFASSDAAHRRIAVAAWAVHRHDPGAPLVAATKESDPGLLARAIRALGELGRADLSVLAASRMSHGEASVRFAGAWSAGLLGKYPNAIAALQKIAESESARARRAAAVALRRMDPKAGAAWLANLPPRLAVIGAGVVGDPALVPGLLDRMKDPKLARVAGEAFTFITGADLEAEKLEGAMPEGFEAGPTDDPADPNVEMDPDDNLPWPDRAAVEKWWKGRSGGFKAGTRHLLGKPIEAAWLRNVLRDGKQRQRAAAALELAILEPGKPLFEVRAPAFRQQRMV